MTTADSKHRLDGIKIRLDNANGTTQDVWDKLQKVRFLSLQKM